MRYPCILLLMAVPVLVAATAAEVVRPTRDFDEAERFELYPGGAATFRGTPDGDAFSQPSANLSFDARGDFFVGNGVFKKLWVGSPASTTASDGLGPLYNARACQRCHLKDGRGRPPEAARRSDTSFVLGLSVPAEENEPELPQSVSEAVIPDPVYGAQLQDHAVVGLPAEGRVEVAYEDVPVELAGGETVSLRKPTYTIADPAHGAPHPELMISPRVAQPMIGLGLLEAVAAEEVLASADPDDADGDGISGKPNWNIDLSTGEKALGRFGWKAIQPTIEQQAAFAFATDMGLSSSLVPEPAGDCTERQRACMKAPHGVTGDDAHEVPDELLALVAFYSRHLAVPQRRDVDDPQVLRGKALFYDIGCTGCHTPKFVTSRDERVHETLRHQLIWPYSDMLLHDMGEGLADHRPQGAATGREWRTQPLWGIGLTQTVNGHTYFLHDGRARNLQEAILWHGGEAQASRDAYRDLPAADRAAILAFLNSL